MNSVTLRRLDLFYYSYYLNLIAYYIHTIFIIYDEFILNDSYEIVWITFKTGIMVPNKLIKPTKNEALQFEKYMLQVYSWYY